MIDLNGYVMMAISLIFHQHLHCFEMPKFVRWTASLTMFLELMDIRTFRFDLLILLNAMLIPDLSA